MLSTPVLSTLLLVGSAAANNHKFGRRELLITDSVKTACDQLSAHASNSTLFPNSTAYETQRINVWDVRANLNPACIYMPTSAEDVAKAVEIFHTNKAPFAVKGGGHMNYPGSNTIDDGILLALNGVNAIKVNADDNNIEVGPGNKWVDVYQALAPHKQYAIGGRLKTIGVPGLTLIGGVSYFLNKYGFSMDNILSYDVVLGNGTQVVASNTSNPDLFWALKGGGSNFGIVTKFVMKTYNIPLVSSTMQVFPEEAIPEFIKAACNMALFEDSSQGAGAVINMNYNTTTKETIPQVFGLQETTDSPPSHFANFTAIPNATLRLHNVTAPIDWHSKFDSPNQMFRVQFGHHTIKPDADRLYEIYESWVEAIQDVLDVEGLRPTYILNLVPKSALTVAKTNGVGNTFGLDDTESYIWWQFTTSWARAEDDLRMTAWHESLLSRHHEINKAKGLATEFIYMGDAGEYQKPFPQYGAENVEKMRQIRGQYDSDLTFTKLNWGGFKLGY
ncbi:FAD binding domain-containing protein [Colletotrichum karsti]|uniref:FAD binding domain-containing protein n=1 Tax=Colletotrichum karsti TaxID=1095194 RepID=A0A9P6LDP0_9PEZI|nr:FAD binding domain-containing protein [Colletotrichum karsti]KAF9872084.1 FAD binding domain-containing protein [Colletotrichum karsti]